MDAAALRTYLEQHLLGAQTVTRLVERRIDEGAGPPWIVSFRDELRVERAIVERIAERLDGSVGLPTRVIGEVGETVAHTALRLVESRNEGLRDLLEVETMFVGVQGKGALWRTLEALSPHPAWGDVDLTELEDRRRTQSARLEELRTAAAAALADDDERTASDG